MEITLNGFRRIIEGAYTINDLLAAQALNPSWVVIELNGKILAKDTFADTQIQPQDTIEILRFVGGG